jgi:hypothetical protein
MSQELIEIKLGVAQIETLKIMLNMELNSRLRMSRHETALQAFKRLTGYDPGRGDKGRKEALAVLAKFDTEE